MNLKDYEHRKRPEIVSNEALKASIELGPWRTTRELMEQFGFTRGIIENHLRAIGKKNQCGKWVSHQISDTKK